MRLPPWHRLVAFSLLYTGCFRLGPFCCGPLANDGGAAYGAHQTESFEGQCAVGPCGLSATAGRATVQPDFHPGEHVLVIEGGARVESRTTVIASDGPEFIQLLVRCDPGMSLEAFETVVPLPPDASVPDVFDVVRDATRDVALDRSAPDAPIDALDESAATDAIDESTADASSADVTNDAHTDASSNDAARDASTGDAGLVSPAGTLYRAPVPTGETWQLQFVSLRGHATRIAAGNVCASSDTQATSRVTSWGLIASGTGTCRVDDVMFGITAPE